MPDSAQRRLAFIEQLAPLAIRVGQEYGLDPRLIIAQAAQETGWGRSVPGGNYFGIKSHGQPGGQTVQTHEYINGQRVNVSDSFRTYGGLEESMRGYAEFLRTNPRYAGVFSAGGLDGQIQAIVDGGYATDPGYGRALRSIARGLDLSPFLNGQPPPDAQPVAPTPQTLSPALQEQRQPPYPQPDPRSRNGIGDLIRQSSGPGPQPPLVQGTDPFAELNPGLAISAPPLPIMPYTEPTSGGGLASMFADDAPISTRVTNDPLGPTGVSQAARDELNSRWANDLHQVDPNIAVSGRNPYTAFSLDQAFDASPRTAMREPVNPPAPRSLAALMATLEPIAEGNTVAGGVQMPRDARPEVVDSLYRQFEPDRLPESTAGLPALYGGVPNGAGGDEPVIPRPYPASLRAPQPAPRLDREQAMLSPLQAMFGEAPIPQPDPRSRPHTPANVPQTAVADSVAALYAPVPMDRIDRSGAPAPMPMSVRPEADESLAGSTYTVRRGDTLSGLARLFDMAVSDIARANQIGNPDVIRTGQTLSLPGPGRDGATVEYVPTAARARTQAPAPRREPERQTASGGRGYTVSQNDYFNRVTGRV